MYTPEVEAIEMLFSQQVFLMTLFFIEVVECILLAIQRTYNA